MSFDILRSRIRIPKLPVEEIPAGNHRGRFVARRQPNLGPVPLVEVVGRAGAPHLGGDRSNIEVAIALASYPQEIRGYGPVKEKSIARVEPMAEVSDVGSTKDRETN